MINRVVSFERLSIEETGKIILIYDDLVNWSVGKHQRITMIAIELSSGEVVHTYPRNIKRIESVIDNESNLTAEIRSEPHNG